ncbi:MAG: hypothetical protein PHN68_12575 [Prolixibacteraceae bacterium]|nr:hypothetical protein [Prolixibacteraceae bacterium]
MDVYARVDDFIWDAFNEGQDLQAQVELLQEADREVPGAGSGGQYIYYPGVQTFFERYRNPLHRGATGTKPFKEIRSRYLKRKEGRESAERNQRLKESLVRGKRGYGLNDTHTKLSST